MCKKTDIQSVRAEALRFLDMPIEQGTNIKHPFTNSWVLPSFDEKSGEMKLEYLDLGSAAYKKWHSSWEERINSAPDVSSIFIMMAKEFRFPFLKNVKAYLSKKDFAEVFADAWIAVENPNLNAHITREECLEYFELCDRADLMSQEEMSAFDDLPEYCTIYRGVTTYNLDDYDALSWTLSEERAEWFAKRFYGKGLVYRASIDKRDILAYFKSRQEEEIIVNPDSLEDIEIHNSFGLDDEDLSFIEYIL